MEKAGVAVALILTVMITSRDDQTGDCLRTRKCEDVRVEQTRTVNKVGI